VENSGEKLKNGGEKKIHHGILTTQERVTFTSQPWIPDRLICQLA
jgi:hypothetical protein